MNNIEYSSVSFIVHGHLRKMETPGFHIQEECCFKFDPEVTSEFVSSGSVTAKGDLAQIYTPKLGTTIFPKNWNIERVLHEVVKGVKEGRVVFSDFVNKGNNYLVRVKIEDNFFIELKKNVNKNSWSIYPTRGL